jgi:8-oxo-dGTP diphosphatase
MKTEMTEAEYLKTYNPNKYERPSLAVDAIVFDYLGGRLQTLLVQRKNHPFQGWWVFPGGFVEVYEDPDEAVHRELREETGVDASPLTQFGVFGRPNRDPRYHVVSVAYLGIVLPKEAQPQAADDASNAAWHPVRHKPPLAFDHEGVLETALKRVRGEMTHLAFATRFLAKGFTGRELFDLYQEVLGRKLDPRRFLRGLARVCTEAPRMESRVRIDRPELKRFEARQGQWWVCGS